MPVWQTILLCLPAVLWTAYCILAFVHGIECKGHCFVNFALIGLALVGYGIYAGVGAFVGVGALVLFFILFGIGVGVLIEHLDRKRAREKEESARD